MKNSKKYPKCQSKGIVRWTTNSMIEGRSAQAEDMRGHLKAFRVGDVTTEKASELLANRPGGFLVYRDELAGWFTSMGRYSAGSGADRAFWLETYGGGCFRHGCAS